MGKCAAKKIVRGYADGGEIDPEMQRKIEANKAKYNPPPKQGLFSGLFGSKPAQPQPQPTVQAQPGMIGAIQNRNEELKKAANYKNGGMIKGPGTPTSDSIPAKVKQTGEDIAVSTGERIVSAEQDAFLQGIAQKMGFKSLDAMLESGTGKPVGPTMKGGMAHARNGAFINPNDPNPEQADALAKQQDEFVAQNKTDISGKGFLARAFSNPNDLTPEQTAASGAMRSGFVAENAGERIGTPPVSYGYTPPESNVPTYGDDPTATAPQGFTAGPKVGDTVVEGPRTAFDNPANTPRPVQGVNANLASGLAAQVNAGVVRQGSSFTGTVPGIKEDMSKPLTSIDMNANNAGMAKANAIRQEMIDSQAGYRAEPGLSGGRIADSGRVEGDALLDKWGRQTDAKNAMQMAANNPRAAQAIASTYGSNVQGETALARDATDQMRNESNNATLRRGQDVGLQSEQGRQNVAMRGQDIGALSDQAKLAILDRDSQRSAEKFGIDKQIAQGQLEDTNAQRKARNDLNAAIATGNPEEIKKAKTLGIAAGLKFDEERTNKPITITDALGVQKLVRDNGDGTYTPLQERGTQQTTGFANNAEAIRIKAEFKSGKMTREAANAALAKLEGAK